MTDNHRNESALKRIINFITFVDLPIKKKFGLFAVGVLVWFLIMFLISIATLVDINSKSNRIVNDVIPHDKVAMKIIRKLQSLSIDATELHEMTDPKIIINEMKTSRTRIDDIRSFLTAMEHGGTVNDYHRETGRLIETFPVTPVSGNPDGEKYIREMKPVIASLEGEFDGAVDLQVQSLSRQGADASQVRSRTGEIHKLLLKARVLSNDYSISASRLYAYNSERIRYATRCTTYTVFGVLVVATGLLVLFTLWISDSIAKPVNSIISQIRSLGEGEVDLSKRLEISSRDEMGTLSKEFNGLMETIHNMATFKKVIEEDENLEDVYSRLGMNFTETVGLKEFIIFEVSNSQNRMKAVYPLMVTDKEMFCSDEILSNCDLCRAKKTGHHVSSVGFPRVCKRFYQEQDRLHVCIPMIVGGSTGGVVQMIFDGRNFDRDDIERKTFRVEQYIKESVSVIEAKRLMNTLRESALKDSLTGLYNRRFLQEYTETLVAGIQRRGKNIGLIMCDLDYFKQVNDLYGHNVGDAVLKETANIIRKSVREADMVIRFGGEEFLVVLLDVNPGDTVTVAEKIRMNIQDAKIKVPDGILKKTISLGLSEFPVDTQSFWQSIKYADVALYKAKEAGRNRVIRFDTEMWSGEQF